MSSLHAVYIVPIIPQHFCGLADWSYTHDMCGRGTILTLKHILCSPYHNTSNGLAEYFV